MLAVFYETPALVGIIIALPSLLLGYLGYRSSLKKDEAAKEVGVASAASDTIEQVIGGQKGLIDALQTEVHRLNAKVAAQDIKLTEINEKCSDLKEQVAVLLSR
jgi:hypothetical protein